MTISISPQHGLNPSLEVCFFCGESKGVIIYGRLKGDVEAPRKTLLNYEPCDTCQEQFSAGILFIKASETPIFPNQLPLHGVYPTGDINVVTEEGVKNCVAEPMLSEILQTRKAIIGEDAWEMLFGGIHDS